MFVLYFLLWIVLNGKVTVEILFFGVLIAFAVTALCVKMFDYNLNEEKRIWENAPLLIRYIFVLIIEIIKAAIQVMKLILSPGGRPDPVIVEFHSGLKTDVQNVLLANSITLTPGTYTIIQEGDRFVVHCLREEYAEGIESSVFVRLLSSMKMGGRETELK